MAAEVIQFDANHNFCSECGNKYPLFDGEDLFDNTCYRCAKDSVDEAKWLAEDYEAKFLAESSRADAAEVEAEGAEAERDDLRAEVEDLRESISARDDMLASREKEINTLKEQVNALRSHKGKRQAKAIQWVAEVRWENFQRVQEAEDAGEVMVATLNILGVDFHAVFLAIERHDTYDKAMAVGYGAEIDDLYRLSQPDGKLQTVKIPGQEGEYLLYVHPYTE